MLSSVPNAAARCSGVSPLVRQSCMKTPVATASRFATFGFAPFASRIFTMRPVARATGLAERRVEWRLSRVFVGVVHIGSALDEKLAQSPVAMEHGPIQVTVLPSDSSTSPLASR